MTEQPAKKTGEGAPRGAWTLVVLTIVAAPAALALETLVRVFLMPPETEALRAFLGPAMTWVNWALAAMTLAAGLLSLPLYGRAIARAKAKAPDGPRRATFVSRKKVGSFMFISSLPQLPALLATIGTLLGGSIVPTLLAVGLVTAFVFLLGRRLTRREPAD